MSLEAVTATARFGLGARPGELAAAATDPRGWLAPQLEVKGIPAGNSDLPASATVAAEFLAMRAEGPERDRRDFHRRMAALYASEVAGREERQARTAAPLQERLVTFWSNHFTVSIQRPVLSGLVGAFEREAIWPNATGRFHDLLRAVVHHPAMLIYLDNARSIGPLSLVGVRRDRGLNENLARELMELHTLGVNGGYSQADVTMLARILTGWSMDEGGAFRFRAATHEPGAKTLLGRTIADGGVEEGETALRLLAEHPATATHIATKLARHFVADIPPPALVARLARRFQDSGGDIGQVMQAVIEAPEAWAEPLAKVRTPHEFILASARALDRVPPQGELIRVLNVMGQPPFAAPSPQGWPDRASDWVAPQALMLRAQWAATAAASARADPRALLDGTLGDAASPATRNAVLRAGSPVEATTLLLASPEFQRR